MNSQRLFFLDNLKAFIVNLMIIFHLAMCYMAYAPEWWYVVDYQYNSLFFTGFIVWADMFIMPMMFFISGYFGIMSLQRHGSKKWWKGRLFRIALPWVLGVAIFAAPVTYLMLYSRQVPIDYSTFLWTLFLQNPEAGGPGVLWSHTQYWYLGILMVFYLLLWLVTKLDKTLTTQMEPSSPGWPLLLMVFVLMMTNTIGTNYYFLNDDLWTFLSYFLVIQPCRIMLYVIWFFLGVYAWRHQWFVENGYIPNQMIWVPGFVIFSFAYPMWLLYGTLFNQNPEQVMIIKAFFHIGLVMTAMLGLLSFFRHNLNFTNKFLGEAAANSYTMYWIHMAVIFPVAYFLLPFDIIVWGKYAIACVAGIAICYVLSRLLLFLSFFAASKKAKVK